MKFPNGYGGVAKLSGNRRRPWVARVTIGFEYDEKTDKLTQKYQPIGYAATRKEALQILSEYNAGRPVKDNIPLYSEPTFEEVYKEWKKRKFELGNREYPKDTIRNYDIAFNKFERIHKKKFVNVTAKDLQDIFDLHRDKSQSTIGMMKTLINQMYKLAIQREYVDAEKDYSNYIILSYTTSEEEMHTEFTREEIDFLWSRQEDYRIQFVLMMIYSGVRPQEFVKIENANVHLEEDYFIGGMKTEAGKQRIIPIHSKTKRFFELNYREDKKYLICKSNHKELTYRDRRDDYSYSLFANTLWTPLMQELGLDHKPHDPRHTFISMMDRAGVSDTIIKRIVGHKITDLTKGTYTHKNIMDLKKEVEKIS